MPVRASVVPLPEPGHAILRISELDAAPEGLTLSIQRQQGPDTHLADDGWRRTETWLHPGEGRSPRRRAGVPSRAGDLRPPGRHRHRAAPGQGARHRRRGLDRRRLAVDADLRRGRIERRLRRHGATAPAATATTARADARTTQPAVEPPPQPAPELRAARDPDLDMSAAFRHPELGHRGDRPCRGGWRGLCRLHLLRRASGCRRRRAADTGAGAGTAGHDGRAAEEIGARQGRPNISPPSPRPRRCWPRAASSPKAGDMAAAFLVFRRAAEAGQRRRRSSNSPPSTIR